jgi:hypothetical protein
MVLPIFLAPLALASVLAVSPAKKPKSAVGKNAAGQGQCIDGQGLICSWDGSSNDARFLRNLVVNKHIALTDTSAVIRKKFPTTLAKYTGSCINSALLRIVRNSMNDIYKTRKQASNFGDCKCHPMCFLLFILCYNMI